MCWLLVEEAGGSESKRETVAFGQSGGLKVGGCYNLGAKSDHVWQEKDRGTEEIDKKKSKQSKSTVQELPD